MRGSTTSVSRVSKKNKSSPTCESKGNTVKFDETSFFSFVIDDVIDDIECIEYRLHAGNSAAPRYCTGRLSPTSSRGSTLQDRALRPQMEQNVQGRDRFQI